MTVPALSPSKSHGVPSLQAPSREAGPAHRAARALRYLAYPLLLLAAVVTAVMAIKLEAKLSLVNFAFVIFAFGYLALMERIIPYKRAWFNEAWEWRRDGLYYLVTMLSGGLGRAVIFSIGTFIAPLHSTLPLGIEIVLAIVTMSVFDCSYHRLAHRVPWLWKLHGVHHAQPKVNVANNNANHVLDVAFHYIAAQLPLFLLGFSQPAVFVATIFKAAQGYGVHANIDVRLGPLNYILVTPEQHRLHHSSIPSESGHYASDLAIWDLLFSSFTWARVKEPTEVGLQDPSTFPSPRSILHNQAHAFRRAGYLQRAS